MDPAIDPNCSMLRNTENKNVKVDKNDLDMINKNGVSQAAILDNSSDEWRHESEAFKQPESFAEGSSLADDHELICEQQMIMPVYENLLRE